MTRAKRETKLIPYTAGQVAMIQSIFDTIPPSEVQSALLDSGDPRAVSLAERLTDDTYSRTQLAKHCFELKLLPKDVWGILIENRKLEARVTLSAYLSRIVATVAESAVPQVVPCPHCTDGKTSVKGSGNSADDVTSAVCTVCGGLAQILRPADKESQKMALEMGEMLNVKVPLIAQQFNRFGSPGTSTGNTVPDMSDWSRNTDSAFEEHDGPEVREAEVVE